MFHFKHFSLSDENVAMKIGTDAVLLGAWTKVSGALKILDIGTGCGIIALMMAQRSPARVDAVEIDAGSASQAAVNTELSPWSDRIKIINSSIQDFSRSCPSTYDLIISNPPYFSNSLKAPSPKRSLARHDDSLPIHQLMLAASKLLLPGGSLNLVFPWDSTDTWLTEAGNLDFHATRLTRVIPREGKSPGRVLAEFRKELCPLTESQLLIRSRDGSYTEAYKALTADFYLGL